MLFKVVTLAFLILLILVVLLQGFSVLFFKKGNQNTNPLFVSFQKSYLLFASVVTFADWLNAPYLYKLYSSYGFLEEQVVIIYVCGLISALFFDIASGYLVMVYREEVVFKVSTILYAVSCAMKISSGYGTLIISRILCGAATSLMFTAQESWYVKYHVMYYDFPPEWIPQTQSKVAKASSFVAISAGVIAYFSTEFMELGAITPTLLSIPMVLLSNALFPGSDVKAGLGIGTQKKLSDDERKEQGRLHLKSYVRGMKKVGENKQFLMIGSIKALFESVICLFVFLWTPVLDHHNPPLGLVFSSFMAANVVGCFLHECATASFKNTRSFMLFVVSLACCAVLLCAVSTAPTNEFPIVSFASFLLFEFAAGFYFPTMVSLHRETGLTELGRVVNAWFKIPVNMLACVGLLVLHSSTNASGTRHIFIGCCFTLSLAFFMTTRLKSKSFDEQLQEVNTC